MSERTRWTYHVQITSAVRKAGNTNGFQSSDSDLGIQDEWRTFCLKCFPCWLKKKKLVLSHFYLFPLSLPPSFPNFPSFKDRVLPCIPLWLRTHDPSASASKELGLQACTATLCSSIYVLRIFVIIGKYMTLKHTDSYIYRIHNAIEILSVSCARTWSSM